MTSFRIEHLPFNKATLRDWALPDGRHSNWPVVYAINGRNQVYIGETLNAVVRMRQHLDSPSKQQEKLGAVRIIVDDTFNKSACLDLESYLIRLFAGDGRFRVLNRNEGITDADYFDRARYRATFTEIFEQLRAQGLFARSLPEIENSDLFKLSPYKALNQDQAVAIEDILEGLFADVERGEGSTIVVQGDPGTGKTVVGIFLMKLLRDIQMSTPSHKSDADSLFSEFFVEGFPELLRDFRMGLVVPQQSLRASIKDVFRRTPGLHPSMVLTPFEVGKSVERFDLLIVDESHRLTQRANQSAGTLNRAFTDITRSLFGADDLSRTQLDWVRAQSAHQIFLLDAAQSVRPADLPAQVLRELVDEARKTRRHYPLLSQMRVLAGGDYISYVRDVLSGEAASVLAFPTYDLRFFDDLSEMATAIRDRDQEVGLARMVSGYAWDWKSRKDSAAFDIELDGIRLRWNRMQVDWINSPGAIDEVGSIHTVQGYDLNYAGVIIGRDLRFDRHRGHLRVDRASYFDKKGKENNPARGLIYTDDDLLRFVTNIYGVLLTRGMRGTYVYVCDPDLREYLRQFFGSNPTPAL
ncbi:DNA/RNA helicase domain-containing protein [Agromyces sp. G08B096]|uniref:DNA/RNA helicase domain-containing protein n=1 Tax=Agromyces sp. G08B096 TaxID=3156399 RepID=A0AAU7WAI6_9MICO